MANPVPISQQLVVAKTRGLLPLFQRAGRQWNLPPEILLGLASRETGIGTDRYYLTSGFTGRDGHGKGIMQIDDRYHTFAAITAPNDHASMIGYGARFLGELRDEFGSIKDALSAYNAGPDAVYQARRLGVDPDHFTTGGDYSKDVLRRARLIKGQLGLGVGSWAAGIPALFTLLVGAGFAIYQFNQL